MKRNKRRNSRAPMIGDMLCSLLTMPLALTWVYQGIDEIYKASSDDVPRNIYVMVYIMIVLFLMGLARLFRAFRLRRKSRLDFFRFLIYGAGMLFAMCTWVKYGENAEAQSPIWITFLVYMGTLMTDRVISIIRNHRLRNILMNTLAIASLVAIFFISERGLLMMSLMMVFASYHALLTIMSVAFARLNLKALREIIQQTYAMEIILGLLLLVASFAYILLFTEPNITNYQDALWYCFAIVTTIGFGDVAATTFEGRLISVILGMYGIVVVALITSIIVNYYGEMKKEPPQEVN